MPPKRDVPDTPTDGTPELRDETTQWVARQGEIDSLCEGFEKEWLTGGRHRIEDYLVRLPPTDRPALLGELLRLDLDYRRRAGETPSQSEYGERFPTHAGLIASVFAAQSAAASSVASLLHVRCPYCHDPFVGGDASVTQDLVCPNCGGRFNLVQPGPEADGTKRRRVAHFELIEALGAGAFGTVWKAWDTKLERLVALKTPRTSHLDEDELERFLNEARAAARLTHRHIVHVHEVGHDGRQFYIATEFIEGMNLKDWLALTHLTPREAAAMCRKLADALDHAHQAQIVHRDLKPGNILIDAAAEPHVADFGLAKRSHGQVAMTVDGCVLGTPAYMSPEQARGHSHEADARSDIYSLGVILFELLTGDRPFRGDFEMLLRQVAEDDPPSPRKLNARIPRDLETICLKCLEKEPTKRYATAGELAAELDRFLQGIPVQARPVGRVERAWRWCRRNPLVAGLAALALASVFFGLGASLVGYMQAMTAQQRAQQNFRNARQAVDELFTEVSQSVLLNQPGMQPLRASLLERARRYYEGFAHQADDDPAIACELAQTYFRLGQIYEKLGSPERALAAYAESRRRLEALVAAGSQDPILLEALGDVRNALGTFHHGRGELAAAENHYDAAVALRRSLAELMPAKQRLLSNTLMNLALAENDRFLSQASAADEHWPRAWRHLEEAQQMRRRALAAGHLSEAEGFMVRSEIAVGDYNRGMFLLERHRALAGDQADPKAFGEAEKTLEVAVESLGQLIDEATQQKAAPHDVLELTFHRAEACRVLADLRIEAGTATDATVYDQAEKLIESLARANPLVAEYQAEWARLCRNRANAANVHGNPRLALASLNQARDILAGLSQRAGQSARWRKELCGVLRGVVILCDKLQRPDEAAKAASHMAAEIQRCLREGGEEAALRQELAWAEAWIQRGQKP